MDRFEQFKSRLGLASRARHQTEKRSTQHAAREANQNRHLKPKEAETLARRIHEMVEELKPELRSRGTSLTALCRLAFGEDQTSSRELHRVTLPPGEDPQKRDVRKHLEPYRKIAKALEQLTQRRSGQLVHRLIEGTACDDLRNASEHWLDMDRLVRALERRIDALDQEFSWTETYRRTLELRKQGAQSGRHLFWPLTDLEPPTGGDEQEALEAYARELEDEDNGISAFYRHRPQYHGGTGNRLTAVHYVDMGAIQDVEFFFVPHAPIGYLTLWDLPQRRSNPAAYEQALARECEMMRASPELLVLPSDRWDESAQGPTGQLDPRNCAALQHHVWLIVYPLPPVASDDTLRIGPALYQANEEGGAWIMPLSSENLAAIADAVWIDETRCAPLVDRLTELLLDEADERSLTANLRRTGPWLKDNPVFKAERQRSQRQQQLLRIAGHAPRL